MAKLGKMKKLGEGNIWFHGTGYGFMGVSVTKGNGGEFIPLKRHNLGGWDRVRLWAEVLSAKKKKGEMKDLGKGHIWFNKLEGNSSPGPWVSVSVTETDAGKLLPLNIHSLNGLYKVKLWAEVIPAKKR